MVIFVQNLSILSFAEGSEEFFQEFNNYITEYSEEEMSDDVILLNSQNAAGTVKNLENTECNIIDNISKEITYTFAVEKSGLYNISVTYYDLLDKALSLKLGFYFDNESKYSELENIVFSKIYQNSNGEIQVDEMGNEIRPDLNAIQRFNTEWVESETGMYSEPYSVYLEAGGHTLTVKKVLGNLAIQKIELKAYNTAVGYDECKSSVFYL